MLSPQPRVTRQYIAKFNLGDAYVLPQGHGRPLIKSIL
jgi:hypothetical protein